MGSEPDSQHVGGSCFIWAFVDVLAFVSYMLKTIDADAPTPRHRDVDQLAQDRLATLLTTQLNNH
jgi:hypothetical protein